MNDIKILNKTIGLKNSPFIIAEMSGNYNQSLDRALKTVAMITKGIATRKVEIFKLVLEKFNL